VQACAAPKQAAAGGSKDLLARAGHGGWDGGGGVCRVLEEEEEGGGELPPAAGGAGANRPVSKAWLVEFSALLSYEVTATIKRGECPPTRLVVDVMDESGGLARVLRGTWLALMKYACA